MKRPVIALLTDFGLRDHYVAAMKGVMPGICPDATLVDISHDIPAQDILAGALELEAVLPHLPPGTVVVAVVDPGVAPRDRAQRRQRCRRSRGLPRGARAGTWPRGRVIRSSALP